MGAAFARAGLSMVPGSRIGRLKATSTENGSSGSSGPSWARQRATVHMPCAIAVGKPNSLAVSGWMWIGFRSPDTAP
jgi:hypothetical protein